MVSARRKRLDPFTAAAGNVSFPLGLNLLLLVNVYYNE
jgi:hypothetical protein